LAIRGTPKKKVSAPAGGEAANGLSHDTKLDGKIKGFWPLTVEKEMDMPAW
jgi:hypothetical protein